jgi:murein DD-endopeptidase MepM/ murein hydrolase activator NlpD
MLSVCLNLPAYRLNVRLVKRRGPGVFEPILSDLEEIKKVKKGHKVSRLFRHIIEKIKIKKILGANLALALIATSLVPAKAFSESDLQDNIVVENTVKLTTEKLVQYPLKRIKITQGYKAFHPGIDFDGVTGDDVFAIKPGRVEAVSHSRYAYGNAILIDHGGNIDSLYAHLSKIFVSEGEEVDFDTILGEVGATGRAFGDHLHLEVRSNGQPVNPYTILPR